jgi:glutathione peroxidase-family protein
MLPTVYALQRKYVCDKTFDFDFTAEKLIQVSHKKDMEIFKYLHSISKAKLNF